jgi:F-type H+-transporting ATPase subunit delta
MSQPMSDAQAKSAVVANQSIEVARRYADALVEAAAREGQVDPLLDEFAEIERDVLQKFPDFAAILASARVPAVEKDRMLLAVFDGRASSLAVRFLRVLNRHGRLDVLGPILREARANADRRAGRVRVRVKTAVPFQPDQLAALKDRLATFLSATPILNVSTDPRLIGGLMIEIGDHRYDASIKNRLEQIRKRLIEGKTHEIQSRRDQFSHSA